jgi:hypothetical protein
VFPTTIRTYSQVTHHLRVGQRVGFCRVQGNGAGRKRAEAPHFRVGPPPTARAFELPSVQLVPYQHGLGVQRPGTQALDGKPPAACCAWVLGSPCTELCRGGLRLSSARSLADRRSAPPFVDRVRRHSKVSEGCTVQATFSSESRLITEVSAVGTADRAEGVTHPVPSRQLRRRRRIPYQATPAAAAAPRPIAVTATAVPEGVGMRARSDTGSEKVSTGQPR